MPSVSGGALATGWFEFRIPDQRAISKNQQRIAARLGFNPVDEFITFSFRKGCPARLRAVVADASDGQGNKLGR
ncbi:hypothetical protein RvVAR031_38170 [Agrobacterium vitis]|nr:hypothetical protein RvVAR031_38170 [Agrobacterium vitis]